MEFYIFLICFFLPFLAFAQPETRTVNVLAVYACDADDHYPFPSDSWRQDLYGRLSEFYKTMSYGQHNIRIREATNNGGFFISKYSAGHYNEHYEKTKHDHGFGLFNEEILEQVKNQLGANIFAEADIIILFGTDGGRGWYVDGVNATGYGALGVTFQAGERSFHRRPGGGGFTVEIGSDYGTPDPDDDQLLVLQQIHWTLAHEYGHWLGLKHRPAKLGIFSLLTPELDGNNRMPEFGPQPLDIFEIIELGWLDENDRNRVQTIDKSLKNQKIALNEVRSPRGMVLLKIAIPSLAEKIYVSYHNQNNLFDGVYPGRGLLIWRKGYGPDLIRGAVYPDKKSADTLRQDLAGKASDFWGGSATKIVSYNFTPARKRGEAAAGLESYQLKIDQIQLQSQKASFKVNLTKS